MFREFSSFTDHEENEPALFVARKAHRLKAEPRTDYSVFHYSVIDSRGHDTGKIWFLCKILERS